jgi:TonB family protein
MSTTFPGNQRAAFLIFLILSALMHAGIWGALQLLPSGGEARPKGEKPPILVDVVDLPPLKGDIQPAVRPPSHAAQREQSVAKESWPESTPRPRLSGPARQASPGAPGKPGRSAHAQKQATGDGQTISQKGPGPVEEPVKAEQVQKGSDTAKTEEASPQPRILAEPKRPSLFPTDDRVAELSRKYETEAPKGEVGKTLSLNTSELKYQRYLMDMKKRIEFYWEYPSLAARNGWQGNLMINFKINRDGSVSDISLERSSGYPMLDDAAMTAVRLAAPFPPFPGNQHDDISIRGGSFITYCDAGGEVEQLGRLSNFQHS